MISSEVWFTSRGTHREKHADAFARIRGLLFLRQGWSFGNSKAGETCVVIATNAFSAASQTNRLSWEDLRRSWVSCKKGIRNFYYSKHKYLLFEENSKSSCKRWFTRGSKRCLQMSYMRFYLQHFLGSSMTSRQTGSLSPCKVWQRETRKFSRRVTQSTLTDHTHEHRENDLQHMQHFFLVENGKTRNGQVTGILNKAFPKWY